MRIQCRQDGVENRDKAYCKLSGSPKFNSHPNHLLDFVLDSPEFYSSPMLVNSPLVCLQSVGILNLVIIIYFPAFVSVLIFEGHNENYWALFLKRWLRLSQILSKVFLSKKMQLELTKHC